MLHKLRRKLILIYGCSTSLILLLVVGILFYSNYHEQLLQLRNDYTKNSINLFESLKTTEYINFTWLVRCEQDTNIMIMLEDNGIDLRLLNSIQTRIPKEQLKIELQEAAKQDGFDCTNPVFHSNSYESKTYLLHKGEKTYYYGTLMTTSIKNGYRTIYLIEEVDYTYGFEYPVLLRYSIIALMGILFFFLFSRFFITLVLKPLETNQKKQREFIASVSHEMKSPLTVLTTGISNLHTTLSSDMNPTDKVSQCQRFLPTLENECSRSSKLINDMLLLAATDTHTWQLSMTELDMETLLIEMFDYYSIYEGSLNRIFQFDLCEEPLHKVLGDKDRIKQVITILIDNGYRYTPADKGITLRAYNTPQHVNIEVIDYGVGISDSNKDRIFDRFYRMDHSRNDKNNFGLGLSIAKELITLHHGKIYVTDTKGGGATFCIKLKSL
ncbi:sensor histidine kinase [Anaerosporobacter faecicola]|uniref:sensor histidine kinase n=1 Tax=Anaerosporobacter faecicola TaxID=2718714 RepID=UPI00143B5A0A|nr:HAMP domain-containing sensor histidine kinase [Anaerosporobacter faecicola]